MRLVEREGARVQGLGRGEEMRSVMKGEVDFTVQTRPLSPGDLAIIFENLVESITVPI